MPKTVSNKIFCPLLNKEIEEGYCWELCNIATNDVLLEGDTVTDWDAAQILHGVYNLNGVGTSCFLDR